MITNINELTREDGTIQTYTGVGGYSITFHDEFNNVVCRDCVDNGRNDTELIHGFTLWETDDAQGVQCGCCDGIIYGEYDEKGAL